MQHDCEKHECQQNNVETLSLPPSRGDFNVGIMQTTLNFAKAHNNREILAHKTYNEGCDHGAYANQRCRLFRNLLPSISVTI